MYHLGVSPAGFQQCVAFGVMLRCGLAWGAGEKLRANGNDREDPSPEQSSNPDQRVKQEADGEIEGDPRQVSQRGWATAGKKTADVIDVLQVLCAVAARFQSERHAHHCVVQALRQRLIEMVTKPNQQSGAGPLERRL